MKHRPVSQSVYMGRACATGPVYVAHSHQRIAHLQCHFISFNLFSFFLGCILPRPLISGSWWRICRVQSRLSGGGRPLAPLLVTSAAIGYLADPSVRCANQNARWHSRCQWGTSGLTTLLLLWNTKHLQNYCYHNFRNSHRCCLSQRRRGGGADGGEANSGILMNGPRAAGWMPTSSRSLPRGKAGFGRLTEPHISLP